MPCEHPSQLPSHAGHRIHVERRLARNLFKMLGDIVLLLLECSPQQISLRRLFGSGTL